MALHCWPQFRQLCHTRFGLEAPPAVVSFADGHTETKHFIYFYLGHCAILLFKTQ